VEPRRRSRPGCSDYQSRGFLGSGAAACPSGEWQVAIARRQLFLQLWIDKGDAVGIFQDELLGPAISQQGHAVARDRKAVGAVRCLFDDTQQASAHRFGAGHPHLGTLQGIEEGGRGVERCPVEGEIDKSLRQRLATRQSDLAGSAAIVIADSSRLTGWSHAEACFRSPLRSTMSGR
jgi:hypothetical protein